MARAGAGGEGRRLSLVLLYLSSNPSFSIHLSQSTDLERPLCSSHERGRATDNMQARLSVLLRSLDFHFSPALETICSELEWWKCASLLHNRTAQHRALPLLIPSKLPQLPRLHNLPRDRSGPPQARARSERQAQQDETSSLVRRGKVDGNEVDESGDAESDLEEGHV
jgi:hypothetical protein